MIVIIQYGNKNERHTTTNDNKNNELRKTIFSNKGHTVTSSTYIKQHLPVAPL